MGRPVTIALDGMGGDHAPLELLRGARLAVGRDPALTVRIHATPEVLSGLAGDPTGRLVGCPSGEAPGMAEAAGAVRRQPSLSVVSCLRDVKRGEAEAAVSAGSTGAFAAAAVLTLGRLGGMPRPALAAIVPTLSGPAVVLDVGGTVDSRPEWLLDFAAMGTAMARVALGVAEPRVGVLNIGEEPGKGDARALALYRALAQRSDAGTPLGGGAWVFAGNVEGRGVFLPEADVVVCDGFAGNIFLKTAEGVAQLVTALLRDAVGTLPWWRRLAATLIRPAFRSVRDRLDPAAHGGAVLLGVRGLCVAAHGSSQASAVASALALAARSARGRLHDRLAEGLSAGEAIHHPEHPEVRS